MGGGQGSLSTAPVDPSLAGGETEDTAATRAMLGADGASRRSSKGSGGRVGDFLRLPFVCVGTERPVSPIPCSKASETVEAEITKGLDVGDIGVATVVGDASPTSGPMVSSVVSPVLALPTVSCEGGRIALPSVEHSTSVLCAHCSTFDRGYYHFLFHLFWRPLDVASPS
jgi:hypothetical protein